LAKNSVTYVMDGP